MMKIEHVEEVKRSQSIPQEVVSVVEEIAGILDREYRLAKDVNGGDGGFILMIESLEELVQLKDIYIDIYEVIPEYTDVIDTAEGEKYTNTLILLSCDFAVSIIMPISLTPKRFFDRRSVNENLFIQRHNKSKNHA